MRKTVIAIVILYAILAFLAYSPVVKWFQDDDSIDLCNGYYITQYDRLQIDPTHTKVDEIGSKILIDDFFVTEYSINDPYIYVKGIHSQEASLSDREKTSGKTVYYCIDSLDRKIIGPFESYELFLNDCNARSLNVSENWETTG